MRRSLREHPFRYVFVGLMLWLTLLSYGGAHLDLRERRARAAIEAETDHKLCVNQNALKAAIRGVVLDNDQVRARLGVRKGRPVSVAIVRREARRTEAPGAYARLLLQFLDRFKATSCGELPSQKLR